MTRKIITGVAGCVLLATIALFAAEKAQGKKPAAKPKQQAKAVEKQSRQQQKGLLDQLIVAYKANDRKKMGAIIKKMEARRDKMQKLAKLNKWHREVHRRWALAGAGRGQRWARGGQRWGRGWAMQMPRGGQHGQGRNWAAQGGWGPQTNIQRPMRGWGQQPGRFRAMRQWRQGPRRNAPQNWNMPAGGEQRANVPPADWGW